jgi:hypothetical protein
VCEKSILLAIFHPALFYFYERAPKQTRLQESNVVESRRIGITHDSFALTSGGGGLQFKKRLVESLQNHWSNSISVKIFGLRERELSKKVL